MFEAQIVVEECLFTVRLDKSRFKLSKFRRNQNAAMLFVVSRERGRERERERKGERGREREIEIEIEIER